MPHNAKVHFNYANFLKDSGQKAESIHHYREALRYVVVTSFSLWFFFVVLHIRQKVLNGTSFLRVFNHALYLIWKSSALSIGMMEKAEERSDYNRWIF